MALILRIVTYRDAFRVFKVQTDGHAMRVLILAILKSSGSLYCIGQEGFFHKILQENLNELFGQPYIGVCIYIYLEKAMAPHSSTLAWKIPWTEETGRLQSMGSRRVRHDWATSLSLFTFMHWRRKCQPTPVFLPRESQGRGSLIGCCLWGCTESDMTEAT